MEEITTNQKFSKNPRKSSNSGDVLLAKLKELILQNLQNEQFGVEHLAREMGMSRSHLHRKLKEVNGKSISQYIRECRLEQSFKLLQNSDLTASEVSARVGFGSPSYFSKCFHEYYGYPPSEAKNHITEFPISKAPSSTNTLYPSKIYQKLLGLGAISIVSIIIIILILQKISTHHTLPKQGEKSIAVFPFKNLSANQDNQYFAEGIVDAITRQLSGIEDLTMVPRSSVSFLVKDQMNPKEVAEILGTTYHLEGSIQRVNNDVRIEVRLVDAIKNNQIWARNFDHQFKDIFQIQNEIAANIVEILQAKLSSDEQQQLNQAYTTSPEAYDLYLRGIYEYRTYTRTRNRLANEYLTKAISLDPQFALAHAYLAATYLAQGSIFGAELSALESLRLAKHCIDLTLSIDPQLPEAHLYLGYYYLYHDWDFGKAELFYQKAIINDNPDALAIYADYLHFSGQHRKGLEIAERLEKVHPYYPNTRMILGLFYTGQYAKAQSVAESRLKIFNNYLLLDSYGFLLLNTHQYQEAIEVFHHIFDLENIRYPRILGWLGAAYAKNGQQALALNLIQELERERLKSNAGSKGFFIAVIYAALGNSSASLNWLEIAVKDHEMEIPWLTSEPQFLPLHDEARFQTLLNQVGFSIVE